MAAQQERVRLGEPVERLADALREPRHVLIVGQNRNPFAVIVRPDAVQPFEHLVAFDREAARGRVKIGEHGGPHRMGVQHRARPSAPGDLDVQQRFGGRFARCPPDRGAELVALQDVAGTKLTLVHRAGGDGQPERLA